MQPEHVESSADPYSTIIIKPAISSHLSSLGFQIGKWQQSQGSQTGSLCSTLDGWLKQYHDVRIIQNLLTLVCFLPDA